MTSRPARPSRPARAPRSARSARSARPARPARSPRPTRAGLDCRTCGACCTPEFRSTFYVGLTEADERRLTPSWRACHVAQGSILTKVDPSGRCVCVALRGRVGGRVSCAIYPRRPAPCRELSAGSSECKKARRQQGL